MEFQRIRVSLPKFNLGYILERKGRTGVEVAKPHELVLYGGAEKNAM